LSANEREYTQIKAKALNQVWYALGVQKHSRLFAFICGQNAFRF